MTTLMLEARTEVAGVPRRPFTTRYRRALVIASAAALAVFSTGTASAMHIAEGFLPQTWALVWFLASAPFVIYGMRVIGTQVQRSPQQKLTLGMSGAFSFVLSALKIPSVTGSCSHPTGVALGAILFGPGPMMVLGTIVLLFQAIILAHGGLTTLGANVFSMAVVGPIVGYWVFRALRGFGTGPAVFVAATISDLATYSTTAVQLALAFPAEVGGFEASLAKFLGIFAITQVPLAVSEGLLTLIIFNQLAQYNREVLEEQGVIASPVVALAAPSMPVWQRTIALGVVAVALATVPFLFNQNAEWLGADDRSTAAITELAPTYQPWFESVFSLEYFDLGDYERYLFEFQAVLGAAVLSGIVGWMIGRRRALDGVPGDADVRNGAMIVGAAILIGIGTQFIETDFGELQAFLSATQGVCFGLVGFFVGYPVGRKASVTHTHA